MSHDGAIVSFRLTAPPGVKLLGAFQLKPEEEFQGLFVKREGVLLRAYPVLEACFTQVRHDKPAMFQIVTADPGDWNPLPQQVVSDLQIRTIFSSQGLIGGGIGHGN